MPAILFVCTGNHYRSPVAAAYLRRRLEEQGLADWQVDSAGTWTAAGRPTLTASRAAAESLGFSLAGHRTRSVDRVMLADYDLILTMEEGQKEALQVEFPEVASRTFRLAEMLDGVPFDIPDPVAIPAQAPAILRDMCDVIERGLPRIRELARSLSRSSA